MGIFNGWLFCVGTSMLPMKMLHMTAVSVGLRHVGPARRAPKKTASLPVAEGKVLVERLREVESEALKELRLKGHCGQRTCMHVIKELHMMPCNNPMFCTCTKRNLNKDRKRGCDLMRKDGDVLTHGFPLKLLILDGRR